MKVLTQLELMIGQALLGGSKSKIVRRNDLKGCYEMIKSVRVRYQYQYKDNEKHYNDEYYYYSLKECIDAFESSKKDKGYELVSVTEVTTTKIQLKI